MKFCSVLLTILFFINYPAIAQDIPEPMSPPRLVNDFARIFNTRQADDLEQMLRNYNDTTSTQIYVVTVKDLQGYAPSDYAFRLGEKWGIGQKSKNNGAVILIKPRIGNERGQVYIATGYGLEPILNDARVGRIIDQYMLPHFQDGDYYSGTKAAIEVMIQYLAGEFQADMDNEDAGEIISWLFIIGLFILIVIISSRGNKNNGNSRSSGGGTFFPPVFPGGGGRSSGGGFGGGFGGGGGGSFGGGGAGRGF